MAYPLFKITNCPDVDWTPFIEMGTWKVNSNPLYESWTDGNGREHRDTIDHKVNGTFKMIFYDSSLYYSFLDRIEAETTPGGYISVTVYDNKRRQPVTINAYLSFEPSNEEPYMDGKGNPEGFEVTIEEY